MNPPTADTGLPPVWMLAIFELRCRPVVAPGLKGTLAEKPRYRPTFYAVIVVATLAGVALNLLRIDVISALFYTAVINGVVAPPLMVLIALLGSDKNAEAG